MLRLQSGGNFVAQLIRHQPRGGDGFVEQWQVQISLSVDAESLREFRRIINDQANKIGGSNRLKGQIGASNGDRRCRRGWPRLGGRQTLRRGGDRDQARKDHYCHSKFSHGCTLVWGQLSETGLNERGGKD